MAAARWIRLDTTWDQSEWLVDLPPASRLVWIGILTHTKAHGVDGRVKRVPPRVFASRHVTGVTVTDVTVLEDAAVEHGALVIEDGEWVVVEWSAYHPDHTARERSRRYRESRSRLSPSRRVTEDAVTERVVTPTKTKTKTRTPFPPGGGIPPSVDRPDDLPDLDAYLEAWPDALANLRRSRGYRPTWDHALAATYLRESPTRPWAVDGVEVPEHDRVRILAAAMLEFAGSGAAYDGRFFQGYVKRLVRADRAPDLTPSRNGAGILDDDEWDREIARRATEGGA